MYIFIVRRVVKKNLKNQIREKKKQKERENRIAVQTWLLVRDELMAS